MQPVVVGGIDRRQLLALPLLGLLVHDAALADTDCPTYSVGDAWKFAVGVGGNETTAQEFGHEVVEVRPDGIVLDGTEANGRPFTKLRVSLELNRFRGPDREDQQLLHFPMAVGARWRAQYKVSAGERFRPFEFDLKRRVTAIEKLALRAGELECIRIDSDGLWSGDGGNNGNFEEHYWYAPKAKHIVKYFARSWEKSGVGRAILAEQAWHLVAYSVS
jgi:hypothetical protein